MELNLEKPIVTGVLRTFVQLSALGLILRPIFRLQNLYLVTSYCFMMIVLAASVACGKSKYIFPGQFDTVLGSIMISVACTGLFAFGAIIRPRPLWNPQYVIPMVGMLLGNSLNGIAITMNTLCIALAEQQREIELYLAFGAKPKEAVSRLLREAVRAGTMPLLNSMAVIGIISIPGMMTGQILGGSPVTQAARYQMMIMYLIAVATFSAIFLQVSVILEVGFDQSTELLRSDRFEIAPESMPFWQSAMDSLFVSFLITKLGLTPKQSSEKATDWERPQETKQNLIHIEKLRRVLDTSSSEEDGCQSDNALRVENFTKVIYLSNDRRKGTTESNGTSLALFENFSFEVEPGEVSLLSGPSGSGKSQLLKAIALLSSRNSGNVRLDTGTQQFHLIPSEWRKRVRYVTQYKIDIPGSPRDFISRITRFKSWKTSNGEWPSEETLLDTVSELIQKFGLSLDSLDKEWSTLSGGESQRIMVAVALSSKPDVLLLDESTSALDLASKLAVESAVDESTKTSGLRTIWVSHDPSLATRYKEAPETKRKS